MWGKALTAQCEILPPRHYVSAILLLALASVMAGLVPASHAGPQMRRDVDARDKPGHDD
jgi:hypothetical protein